MFIYENCKKKKFILFCIMALFCSIRVLFSVDLFADSADEIINVSLVKGGLIVHIGCDNPKFISDLHQNGKYLVQALEASDKNIQKARSFIQQQGRYGKVSIRKWDGKNLPYTDRLVNLLITDKASASLKKEVMRVLVPGGVLFLKEKSEKVIKPWPGEMDQWTHYLHGADNNAVSQDTAVGPPKSLKWVGGPLWARSHEFNSSISAMVTGNGRIFYIFDEGLTSVTDKPIPEKWTLIARDAFNGLILWKCPLDNWNSDYWKNRGLRSMPGTVPRRLIADDNKLFFTLGYNAPVSLLDPATGKILKTYKDTDNAIELRYKDGILILNKKDGSLMAINTKTGKKIWEKKEGVLPFLTAIKKERVFYKTKDNLFCCRLDDGKELWKVDSDMNFTELIVYDNQLLVTGNNKITSYSSDTGKIIWQANFKIRRRGKLFIANNRIWYYDKGNFLGLDPATGEKKSEIDPSEVFTGGHHFRCYPSRATENYIITPNRGVEFISLTGMAHTQSDWLRGPCMYGVIPANGLLYVAQNPCFCYTGVKIRGFNALGSKISTFSDPASPRMIKGPAFGSVKGFKIKESDWPVYRYDSKRFGSTETKVPARLKISWKMKIGGKLTQPIIANNKVFVAAVDMHMIYTLDEQTGKQIWNYTASGRIDSSPTVYGDMLIFGCSDGTVTCLRNSDGALVWKFRAAPNNRMMMAFGHLESSWPVHGSVLLHNKLVYFTAGRSSYLDGGIFIFGLVPETGEIKQKKIIDTWSRTREDAVGKPFIPAYHMEGTHSDILVSEGGYIYLGQMKFNKELVEQDVPYILPDKENKISAMFTDMQPFWQGDKKSNEKYEKVQRNWLEKTQKDFLAEYRKKYGSFNMGERKIGRHVFSTAGFLDDSYFNRTFWMYSSTWPGFYLAHRASKTGQIISVDDSRTYAFQAFPSRNLQSPLFVPGDKGYLLFADDNENEPVLDDRTQGVPKGMGFTRTKPPLWYKWVPVRVRAMVAAGEVLFISGLPDVIDQNDIMASFEGRKGAVMWAVSTDTGDKLAEYNLKSSPVFDGISSASGKLFISLTDGTVLCYK